MRLRLKLTLLRMRVETAISRFASSLSTTLNCNAKSYTYIPTAMTAGRTMSTPSRSKAVEVPPELWHEILCHSCIEDVLKLERTCRFFLTTISDRHFWLRRLQELDFIHAPDLPSHLSVDSMTYLELRNLVVRARRRVLKFTGLSILQVSKEITIPIGRANMNGILGDPSGWGAGTLLLPGGQYLLIRWPAGYLQCWNVITKACLWTYPSLFTDMVNVQRTIVTSPFAGYVCPNGEVYIAVVTEAVDDDQRSLEILGLSLDESLSIVFQAKPLELGASYGIPAIVKLHRDVSVAYTEGYMIVFFWRDNRSVVITEGMIDALEIIDGFIIGVTSYYDGNSLIAVPLKALREVTTPQIRLGDLPISSCQINQPVGQLIGRALLSVCSFHWQEPPTERKDTIITVIAGVYNEQNLCDFPTAEFFSFNFDMNESWNTRQSFRAETRTPTLKSLGRSSFTSFDPQFNTYSVMTPPSQSGSTVLAFHDDRGHETRFARTLCTFMPGSEVAIRFIDEGVVGGKPATYSLNVEFYSGAIYYVTMDLQSVVIRYLD